MSASAEPSLGTVLRAWGRIGCLGFGGPPAHIAMLRELCVDRHGWLTAEEFEHGVAACNLLPGPASTQLAIFCAWRVRGGAGAVVGGAAFILPGLVAILALAALFLGSPPRWLRGVGAGAGAVVAAVAVQAALSLMPRNATGLTPAVARNTGGQTRCVARWRWAAYVVAGAVATVALGPWVVLVLLGCGVVELLRSERLEAVLSAAAAAPLAAAASAGGLGALCWTALKVGALSYGGGFVIVPLMQADATERYGWMSHAEFLNAVALGQATPGPVTHTVAVVGYAAHGLGGALLAALVAFAPSFGFVLLGARRFDRLRTAARPRAFLAGAGPAAIGAILGSAVLLAAALSEAWQVAVLAGGAVLLLVARRGVVFTLLLAGAAGAVFAVAGAPLP